MPCTATMSIWYVFSGGEVGCVGGCSGRSPILFSLSGSFVFDTCRRVFFGSGKVSEGDGVGGRGRGGVESCRAFAGVARARCDSSSSRSETTVVTQSEELVGDCVLWMRVLRSHFPRCV